MAPPMDDADGARALAIYRMSVAKEDLSDAERNLSERHYRIANNRAYYAIFHAICACLATRFKAFKSHAQTIGYFNKEFVHTGIFPTGLAKRVSRAQEVRNASDYEDFYIVAISDAEEQVRTAREVVSLVDEYLQKICPPT